MSQSRRVCLSVFSPDCSMQSRHMSRPCCVDAGSLLVALCPRSQLACLSSTLPEHVRRHAIDMKSTCYPVLRVLYEGLAGVMTCAAYRLPELFPAATVGTGQGGRAAGRMIQQKSAGRLSFQDAAETSSCTEIHHSTA